MIGDILHDVEAGNRAGCKTVMIHNGNETEWVPGPHRVPEYFAKDLSEAAKYILTAKKVMGDAKKLERQAEYIVHKA
jgi:ribonucleotide monophosphatase NagD (HAD superfamily)